MEVTYWRIRWVIAGLVRRGADFFGSRIVNFGIVVGVMVLFVIVSDLEVIYMVVREGISSIYAITTSVMRVQPTADSFEGPKDKATEVFSSREGPGGGLRMIQDGSSRRREPAILHLSFYLSNIE